jgi:hypothetical protein
LARPLPSAPSADDAATPPLFEGFLGTMGLSDFPPSFIAVVPRSGSRRGRRLPAVANDGISQFLRLELASMRGVFDLAGPDRLWPLSRRGRCCLPPAWTASAPGSGVFRGSIPGLLAPLSTLHPRPHGRRRMTRGRCGWLRLHRTALSSATPGQCPGAFPRHPDQAPQRARRARTRCALRRAQDSPAASAPPTLAPRAAFARAKPPPKRPRPP